MKTLISFFVLHCLLFVPSVFANKASIYDYKVKNIDGAEVDLSSYKGKVLLIVNTASECGFTPQYEGLQELHEKYKTKSFSVLAFPSNNFGGQEPGSNKEIKIFCEKSYKVSFPLFAKVDVKGKKQEALFKHLTDEAGGGILWNFEKFLVGRDGRLIRRYRSTTKPGSESLIADLEKALAQPE